MNRKRKTQRGITLIALVITIIVMLILVAVTISMAVNGGLFEYAGKATKDTQNAIDEEQELADGRIQIDGEWYDDINKYINKVDLPTYEAAKTNEDGLLTENAIFKSGKLTAVIPKGFKVVEGLNGTTTIEDGLVIQDSKRNEFVWIPVTYTPTGKLDSNGFDTGFLNVFKTKDYDYKYFEYAEPYEGGYTNEDGTTEVDDYNDMVKSVYENGGFYIGRYEAGTTTKRIKASNGTMPLVVQRDAYPYIYVGWGISKDNYIDEVVDQYNFNQGHGAVYLSEHLLDGQETGATSTLCYGVQWDAMLNFLSDEYDLNSISWGNSFSSSFKVTRSEAKFTYIDYNTGELNNWTTVGSYGYLDKKSGESFLLTTGAYDEFASKNIFDVAGNVYEWTMEKEIESVSDDTRRVVRGRIL